MKIDINRDANLTDFSQAVLQDRYLLEGETFQELFARVATAYQDDEAHGQRIYDYISKCWFMPATPVLANGGTTRGLPISCFLNEVNDTVQDIAGIFYENTFLASSGGGIGTYWGNIREQGAKITNKGKSSGIVPFLKVQDSYGLAVSQGGLRGGASASYLDISHPEIEEFIDIRRPTGGDPNRRCLNIHHGVVITDAFMNAVQTGKPWELKSPKTGEVTHTVNARDLWIRILASRVETGEPYILFKDNANKNISTVYQKSQEIYGEKGLHTKTSNLCIEVMLHTGRDYLNKERTAVCCLSSLNLEYYEQWKDSELFIEDIMNFLDNVLQDFIERAPDSMARAKYSAMRERSVGLGVMGFHSFLQSKMTPIEGVAAKSWNKQIFAHIKEKCDAASKKIAQEKGACPDAEELGIIARFSNCTAIAPTASISVICGNASAGIDPFLANCYTHKTLSGSFIVRNKYLKKLLQERGKDTDDVWSSIATNEGSVQHLDFLTTQEKDVFKRAIELDQMWLIEHAADRQPFIDQGQSLNVFIPSNVEKKTLHEIHYQAWKKGVKSLYYCRSASIQRAEKAPNQNQNIEIPTTPIKEEVGIGGLKEVDECIGCQ